MARVIRKRSGASERRSANGISVMVSGAVIFCCMQCAVSVGRRRAVEFINKRYKWDVVELVSLESHY